MKQKQQGRRVKQVPVLGLEHEQPEDTARERPVKPVRDEVCILKPEVLQCCMEHNLVVGPECTQPQDIAITLAVAQRREVEGCGVSAWPAGNLCLSSCLEQFALRTCFVKLDCISQELHMYQTPQKIFGMLSSQTYYCN